MSTKTVEALIWISYSIKDKNEFIKVADEYSFILL